MGWEAGGQSSDGTQLCDLDALALARLGFPSCAASIITPTSQGAPSGSAAPRALPPHPRPGHKGGPLPRRSHDSRRWLWPKGGRAPPGGPPPSPGVESPGARRPRDHGSRTDNLHRPAARRGQPGSLPAPPQRVPRRARAPGLSPPTPSSPHRPAPDPALPFPRPRSPGDPGAAPPGARTHRPAASPRCRCCPRTAPAPRPPAPRPWPRGAPPAARPPPPPPGPGGGSP